MSIRCAFRFLASRSFNLFLVAVSQPPTRPKIAPFKSGRRLLARLYRPVFFRCLGAPPRTGNTPPKDNYNKSLLAQYLAEHCGGYKVSCACDPMFCHNFIFSSKSAFSSNSKCIWEAREDLKIQKFIFIFIYFFFRDTCKTHFKIIDRHFQDKFFSGTIFSRILRDIKILLNTTCLINQAAKLLIYESICNVI